MVDVVVRNKRGRPVPNLEQTEFQVAENGQPVKITGFKFVQSETTSASVANAANTTLDPSQQLNLVTIVFERLGPDGRNLARRAALDLLKTTSSQNLFYAVFSIDQRLNVLQPFTGDKPALAKAVMLATGGTPSQFATQSDNIRRALEGMRDPLLKTQNDVQAPASGAGQSPDSARNRELGAMTENMLLFSDSMARTDEGRSSIFSLMAIAHEQSALPGVKTIIYFSEGIEIPNNLGLQLRSLIEAANRANVHVYAVDARGLLAAEQNLKATAGLSETMADAAQEITSQIAPHGNEQQNKVTPGRAKALERGEDSIRANGQNFLAELAESTGGLLIANSNDLRASLQHAVEDARSHYEITYVPKILQYDGRFRTLSVRVARRDVLVQTRNGYFALPAGLGDTLAPYEIPLLAALSQSPAPRAFNYHAALFHFGQTDNKVNCAAAVEVPMAKVTFAVDKKRNVYRTHLSVLALFKNAAGDVVEKIAKDIPYEGPIEKSAELRKGALVLTEHRALPPGRYTLETAVLDHEGGTVSTRNISVLVPEPVEGLSLSSVSMVRRVDPLNGDPDPADPFASPAGKVTPTLTDSFTPGEVSLYFVVFIQTAPIGRRRNL